MTIETQVGEPVGYGARVGDCIYIPAGPLAGTWEIGSMWGRAGFRGGPLTQHPVLISLTEPQVRREATHEELACYGAMHCARPAARPGRCAAARPDGTYRCWEQAEDGSDYCRRHAPCSVCGEPRGPVPHYASAHCRCGGQAHCTCAACF